MNYGPLEFEAYARQGGESDSATVKAARSAAPTQRSDGNRLTVIAGSTLLALMARGAQAEAVSVYEAVALQTRGGAGKPVDVRVRSTLRPMVLVLSAHQPVQWEIALAPGATLSAVLLAGYGESTVSGAGKAVVASIGGYYAFKRGSHEYKHLESEVMRCTGQRIESFHSAYAGASFEVG